MEYYKGLGSGDVSWAPIMGNSYGKNVTQWSKGEYTGANNTEDDIALIAGNLTTLADDHGNTPAKATPLVVEADGQILVSTPETDPGDLYPDNKGVIESRSDVDVFSFSAPAGQLEITVTPAWAAFYRTSSRGANLDIQAVLLDSTGKTIATADPPPTPMR